MSLLIHYGARLNPVNKWGQLTPLGMAVAVSMSLVVSVLFQVKSWAPVHMQRLNHLRYQAISLLGTASPSCGLDEVADYMLFQAGHTETADVLRAAGAVEEKISYLGPEPPRCSDSRDGYRNCGFVGDCLWGGKSRGCIHTLTRWYNCSVPPLLVTLLGPELQARAMFVVITLRARPSAWEMSRA